MAMDASTVYDAERASLYDRPLAASPSGAGPPAAGGGGGRPVPAAGPELREAAGHDRPRRRIVGAVTEILHEVAREPDEQHSQPLAQLPLLGRPALRQLTLHQAQP